MVWYSVHSRGPGNADGTDNNCPTAATMQEWAVEPNTPESDMSEDQKNNLNFIELGYGTTETEPKDDETWAEFQQRLYTEHRMMIWYGTHVIPDSANVAAINVHWLWSGADYQICGIMQNIFGQTGDVKVYYFSTTASDNPQEWTIGVSHATTVTISDEWMRDTVSYQQGVNPKRNTVTSKVETPATRLLQATKQTKTFTGILFTERGNDATSTAQLADIGTEGWESVESAIKGVSGHEIEADYANAPVAEPATLVNWVKEPTSATATAGTNNVTIGLESNATSKDQQLACIVSAAYKDDDSMPTAEQVWLGLDSDNSEPISKKLIAAHDGTATVKEIVLDGLMKGTKYNAFCTATNGYPGWPKFVVYNGTDTYKAIVFTTLGEADEDDDDDDQGLLISSNLVALCTMLAALIFN